MGSNKKVRKVTGTNGRKSTETIAQKSLRNVSQGLKVIAPYVAKWNDAFAISYVTMMVRLVTLKINPEPSMGDVFFYNFLTFFVLLGLLEFIRNEDKSKKVVKK